MPLKLEPDKRRIPIGRIVSGLSLLLAVTALVLALKKPQPVAPTQTPTAKAANADSFQAKVNQLAQAQASGQTGTEVHLSADEIRAAFTSAPQEQIASAASAVQGVSGDDVSIGEPIVSFEGDEMKGQFVSEVGGKKLYITVNGHLGAKDGYATFEPTEFKVGDLVIPVSLVNDALQKKMAEQRDRMKLPDYISDLKVENGELVIKQK